MEAVRRPDKEQVHEKEEAVEPPVPEPLDIAEYEDKRTQEVIKAELEVLEKMIKDNQKLEKDLLMDVMDAERNGEDEDAIDAL